MDGFARTAAAARRNPPRTVRSYTNLPTWILTPPLPQWFVICVYRWSYRYLPDYLTSNTAWHHRLYVLYTLAMFSCLLLTVRASARICAYTWLDEEQKKNFAGGTAGRWLARRTNCRTRTTPFCTPHMLWRFHRLPFAGNPSLRRPQDRCPR